MLNLGGGEYQTKKQQAQKESLQRNDKRAQVKFCIPNEELGKPQDTKSASTSCQDLQNSTSRSL